MSTVFTGLEARVSSNEKEVVELKRENTGELHKLLLERSDTVCSSSVYEWSYFLLLHHLSPSRTSTSEHLHGPQINSGERLLSLRDTQHL